MKKQVLVTELWRKLSFEPLTKNNWDKFVGLFGEKGACGNCWCMFYRLSSNDFRKGKEDEGNKRAIKEIVMSGKPTGLLGIIDGEAIAWCAFAPREDFIRLERSRIHRRIDQKEVWSIPCFFINKRFRNSGITRLLLKEVIRYAKEIGVKIIEAYPVIPGHNKIPDTFAWMGLISSFEHSGFGISSRKSKNRPMVRYYVDKNNEE